LPAHPCFLGIETAAFMKQNSATPADNSWESDAVWRLLEQVPPASAGPRFADDTVRAAKLLGAEKPWWSRIPVPATLAGLAGAAAAIALSFFLPGSNRPVADAPGVTLDSPQAAQIQDIAETETLIAAADQLDDYSDNELVSLIGF
jgi:hypothetical protein